MTEKKKKQFKPAPLPDASQPAQPTRPEIHALQALYEGRASKRQQQTAFNFIVNKASGAHNPCFRKGGTEGERDTAFALGRAFVGQQIIGLLKINLFTDTGD